MADDHILKSHWELIPDNTDILIVHGPPYGFGDRVNKTLHDPHVGSKTLTEKIKSMPNLQSVICGHIHEGFGQYGNIINASQMDGNFKPTNHPVVWEI